MYQIKIVLFVILLFTAFVGCKNSINIEKSVQISENEKNDTTSSQESNLAHQNWKDLINQKSDSISLLYSEHAVKILENENIIVGRESIKKYYQNSSTAIKSIVTDSILMANEKRGLQYEIGEYVDNENVRHKQMVIWETVDGQKYRVFEFTARVEESKNNLEEIDVRRDLWIELCNKHNPANLINEMYSPNTLYFNHKPMVIGRKALIEEYAYINNENYELTLNPIILDQVNDKLAFEIGQCVGSYNGKYIIIWRRSESDKWEVFIDSNI